MSSPSLSSFAEAHKCYLEDSATLPPVVEAFLANIARDNPRLNAFVRTYEAAVRQRAAALAAQPSKEKLAGMVVGLKDLFSYAGHPVQAGSKILAGFQAQYHATVVARLLAADALIVGHQNCDEFGMGSANKFSTYGPATHPHDATRVPGGSSGGSAAAVAASMCHVALGTDTGGSVRQPAALCGIVGLKPTYSRISRYGVIAYASSFDTVGILARNVYDAAALLEVIAGEDPHDNTSASHEVPAYTELLTFEGPAKVACLGGTMEHEGLQPAIQERLHTMGKQVQEAGHHLTTTTFPLLSYALPTYCVLTTAEASANLSRYDGIRFGMRATEAEDLAALYTKTRTQGFGQEVKRRILLGTFVLSTSYYDAYYTQAQRVRRLIKEALEAILAAHDFILLPTTPTTASPQDQEATDPVQSYLADTYTVLASLAGLPAVSIPCGHDAQGLPIGLQLIGRPFQEERLLAFAQQLMHY